MTAPPASAATRPRSSSGRSMAKGRSSDASTAGSQSSRSARSSTRNQRSVSASAPARGRRFCHGRDAGGKPDTDLLECPLDPQVHFVPVRSLGESCENALRRSGSCGRLEGAGQGPSICDAIQPERPVLADLGLRTRHVPTAGMDDEPVRVLPPPRNRSARFSSGLIRGCRPELGDLRAGGVARVVRPEPRVLIRGSGLCGGASWPRCRRAWRRRAAGWGRWSARSGCRR